MGPIPLYALCAFSITRSTLSACFSAGVRELGPWTDWFFPARCELCHRFGICPEHPWPTVDESPRCLRCAALLPPGIAPRAGCAACFGHKRRATRGLAETIALGTYDASAPIRPWILALKHSGRPDLAAPLGALLAAHPRSAVWRDSFVPPIQLVPIPIHRWRRWSRGYNQAALLAEQVALLWEAPTRQALFRTRATPPQGSFGSASRGRNVDGAFAIHPEMRRHLHGARIVLVDDVFTSGATLGEAARCLRRAGAAWVGALVLSRVEPVDKATGAGRLL